MTPAFSPGIGKTMLSVALARAVAEAGRLRGAVLHRAKAGHQ